MGKFIAFSLILITSPLFVIISISIFIAQGLPIFFKQARTGLHGKPFYIYKFRTMNDDKDAKMQILPDEVRMTKIGRFLRKYSLDELPQLINIIKGDMNFVGPRPLLVKYLPLYTLEENRRHDVKPGITGWAQVNGRNAITWEEKFCLDVWYVDNQSFFLDMRIIWLTLNKVFHSEGINEKGKSTMSEFKGHPKTSSIKNILKENKLPKIAILGAGGFGREVAQLIKDINYSKKTWDLIGYFDDDISTHGLIQNDFHVLGEISLLNNEKYNDLFVICAVGGPKIKYRIIENVKKINPYIKFPILKHPSVKIGDGSKIGEGSIICAGSIITTNVTIGQHTSIHVACTIGHDTFIHDFCTVLPGVSISGNVIMHEGVCIGTKAAVIQGVKINQYTIVGAGAVVVKSLPEYCTAIGIPARAIKFHEKKSERGLSENGQ